MSKHTPGKWSAITYGDSFYIWADGQHMVADEGDDGIHLARMRGVGRGATDEEMQANAHLIAAAPDLLEALKHLLEDAIAYGLKESEFGGVVIEARKAIAKAEGQ